jgi:hypothetical protein
MHFRYTICSLRSVISRCFVVLCNTHNLLNTMLYKYKQGNMMSSNLQFICLINDISDRDSTMVECCNIYCTNSWFHLECCQPPLDEVPADHWYCSDNCRTSEGFVYCVCKTKKGREDNNLVRCKLGSSCHRYEKYHPSCIGIPKSKLPSKFIFIN